MERINLADAKARLSELVERAQRGEEVQILKRGKPVARLVASARPRRRISLADLRSVTDGQAEQAESAGAFIRRMRDESRY